MSAARLPWRLRVRQWSVRRARLLETIYNRFEPVLLVLAPVFETLGYERAEKPVAWVESRVKGLLFGCRMCGQCVLQQTGMSCPMNCPKNLRNGPCGGVRPDGGCEVEPAMPCVWVQAYQGSLLMRGGHRITEVQFAADSRLEGRSSWLRVIREQREAAATIRDGSVGT